MNYSIHRSGLIVPAAEKKSPQFNHIDAQHEWVRDYMPGNKRYTDPDVQALNQELASISAGRQKLFAVKHEEHPRGNVVGVLIWVTDPDNPRAATCLGNPCQEKFVEPGGRRMRRAVPNTAEIMRWLSAVNLLSDENKDGAKAKAAWYDEENKKVEDAREAKADAKFEATKEKYKMKYTEDCPSRTDRTLPNPDPSKKKRRVSRSKKGGDDA